VTHPNVTNHEDMTSMSQVWELLNAQQKLAHDQQAQIEEQRESIALLQTKLAALDRRSNDAESAAPLPRRLSRKGLLGAAAAGAAGLVGIDAILNPQTAAAGTDGDVVLGALNQAASVTQIDASSANAIYGLASGGGTGVQGGSDYGNGVTGSSTSFFGVYGHSGSYIGVSGYGGAYGGQFGGGSANLLLDPAAAPGAPTGQFHLGGEIYVDSLAVPYVCEANGTPGTWQAVGNFRPFPAGHRVFNTSMAPGGLNTGISALIDVHAMSTGVPATAIAVYCAVQSYESGTLTIFPDGASEPPQANWSGVGTTGILNLLYMVVPLSSAGNFSIRSHLTATGQVFVDVWGYLM
jgi:hypothetical protein